MTSTAGKVEQIKGPDGKERRSGEEVGVDKQGWFTFKVAGVDKEKAYSVETAFVQTGQSTRQPWNFYYWPTKSDVIHEPWAGGNGRVDTAQTLGDDERVLPYGSYVAPWPGHHPRRAERHPRNSGRARRRRYLVPQPL